MKNNDNNFCTELVTVVTPTYRKFDYIYKVIDSVLMQNYPMIEYIIIDDGSENFPESKIKHYLESNKNKNILNYKILKHAINKGTVSTMNEAYSLSEGYYLIPLAGDDFFVNDKVISRIVKKFKDMDADIICGRRIMCKDGKIISRHYIETDAGGMT